MSHRLLLMIAFLITSSSVLSQSSIEDIKKTHIIVTLGLNIPDGDIASTEIWVDHDGFANPGFSIGLEVDRSIGKIMELGFIGYYSINSFNETNYINKAWGPERLWFGSLKTSSWIFVDLYPNVGIKTVLNPTINFYGKGYFGLSIIQLPKIDGESEGGFPSYYQKAVKSYAFGYGLGIGLTFNDMFDAGFRYFFSAHHYEKEIIGQDELNNGWKDKQKYWLKSSRILFTIGYIF
jgi:hypothetical protein